MQKEEYCPIPDTPELQWLALSLVPGLGFRSIQEMLNAGKSISELIQATPGELVRDLGINSKVANKIASASKASTRHRKKDHRGKSRDSAILSRVRGISFAVDGNRESAQCALLERNRRSGPKTLSCFRWFPCLQCLWAIYIQLCMFCLAILAANGPFCI